ncbi:peptidoglycan-binding protein [Actinopolymorpha pittospori]
MSVGRRLPLILGSGVIAVAVAGAAVAAGGFGGQATPPPAAPTTEATEPVRRATLVDYTDVDGTLGYPDPTSAANQRQGTVTMVPRVGTLVSRGRAVYRIDDQPVTLMYGAVPAYRRLAVGTRGRDVRQFEQNLRALGHGGFDVDDEYTHNTADAVKDWQDDIGVAETGAVELGQVVFGPGAVRVAAVAVPVGQVVTPGQPVLSYTGQVRAVTVDLDTADQRLARVGTTVKVRLPDDQSVDGRITSVGAVATAHDADDAGSGAGGGAGGSGRSGDGSGGSGGSTGETATVEVTVAIADQRRLGRLDQAPVTVHLVSAERRDVLTVPVAALLALREGGYGVEVVEGGTGAGARSRIVAVEVGMFADGRVEIGGSGVREGMRVGVPVL